MTIFYLKSQKMNDKFNIRYNNLYDISSTPYYKTFALFSLKERIITHKGHKITPPHYMDIYRQPMDTHKHPMCCVVLCYVIALWKSTYP